MADPDTPYDPDAQAENIPLYIIMLMYFLTICGVGLIASGWKEAAMKKGEVAAHFGGEFSTWIVVLTTFSSVYSGFTVVGVPTEAKNQAYFATRWISAVFPLAMLIYVPRLRRLAKSRIYLSPNDFLADRFRDKMITICGSVCTCFPQLFYLTVQLLSFSSLLNGLTAGAIPNIYGMLLFAVIVLVLEKVGGMNSVVLSDAIQALLMIFGFLAIFTVICFKYGTLADLQAEDCASYGLVNQTAKELFRNQSLFDQYPPSCSEPHPDCVAFGCIPAVADQFKGGGKVSYFWFLFNFISFPLNPHIVQRIMIAKEDDGVRTTIKALCFSGYLTMLPGIAVGITAQVYAASWPLSSSEVGALASIQNEIKKDGPFQYALVAMLSCAALAAIMSTADSVILGVSNSLAIDIYKGILKPNASSSEVVHCGTIVSVVFTGIAFFIGLFITSDMFGALLSTQNAFLLQIVPAFIGGLYFERISVLALQAGLAAGLTCVPIFFYATQYLPAFVVDGILPWVPAANLSAFVNLVVFLVLQVAGMDHRAGDESADAYAESLKRRFGEQLTNLKLHDYIQNDVEVSTVLYWVCVVLTVLSFPWYFDINEVLGGAFGFPVWSLFVLVFTVFICILCFVLLNTWKPGHHGPPPVDKEMGSFEEVQLTNMRSRKLSAGLL